MKRKIAILILTLLLLTVGLVGAGSSPNYSVQRSVTLSGGVSESANYKVTSVIGQPLTGISDSANYEVSAGFLFPGYPYTLRLPIIRK